MSKAVKLRFHFGYFSLTVVLLLVEVLIAKYVQGWVRSYFGDVLVVMLIYAAIMTVMNLHRYWVILATLLFAFTIETLQYFKLAEWLGFEKGSLGYIILGNTFSVEDLLCYALGCLIVLWIEIRLTRRSLSA